jgi:DNA-binding transcriptional ArsR family regulator
MDAVKPVEVDEIDWERFAVAMVHPVPVAIVRMLALEGVLSPNEIATRLQMSIGRVSYHVRLLADREQITLERTEPRRGAIEHFYRLT